MGLFTGKTLLISGGTGFFGNAVFNRFLATDIGKVKIFSHDEKKQDDMCHEFQVKMPELAEKIKFLSVMYVIFSRFRLLFACKYLLTKVKILFTI